MRNNSQIKLYYKLKTKDCLYFFFYEIQALLNFAVNNIVINLFNLLKIYDF